MQLKQMMQDYESGREDSLLLPPPPRPTKRCYRLRSGRLVDSVVSLQRKPDQLLGSCEKCGKPYPATVGTGRLRRCLACDLQGIPGGGGGDAPSWGKVTARYRRWRGFPYEHPSKNESENENKDKDMAGRRKACLYRKREEPFFDYHRVRRKEAVRQMDEHSRRHKRLRRKRGRLVDEFIVRLLSLQSKYQRTR